MSIGMLNLIRVRGEPTTRLLLSLTMFALIQSRKRIDLIYEINNAVFFNFLLLLILKSLARYWSSTLTLAEYADFLLITPE